MSGIYINHNSMAANTANVLTKHYSDLATSTQRLSSGLRINGAADDAAGLAIRELQRADIAALNQGVRNANDAISMLQTFDGALSVIDEKLIRMKELAEQAATGTYDSTQRLMIDSEFQAMGSEINRIANATDFNGVKLLCTKMMTWYTDEDRFVPTDPGTITNVQLPVGKNGTPVLRPNPNPLDYIGEANPTRTISVNLTAQDGTKTYSGKMTATTAGNTTTYTLGNSPYTSAIVVDMGTVNAPIIEYNGTRWTVTDRLGSFPNVFTDAADSTNLMAMRGGGNAGSLTFSLTGANNTALDFDNIDPNITKISVDTQTGDYEIIEKAVVINANTADYTASYNADNQTVTVALKNGGTATLRVDNPLAVGDNVAFDITFAGEVKTVPVEHHGVDPDQKVKIHFGSGNDSAEDYYYINYSNATLEGLGLDGVEIKTQDQAQGALVQIDDAIVQKDKIRAEYGAMQNRLENTITNNTTQAENLQASETRISDADIAQEMMTFVRNQILTQSAVAMLAQANSVPQMVMRLIG